MVWLICFCSWFARFGLLLSLPWVWHIVWLAWVWFRFASRFFWLRLWLTAGVAVGLAVLPFASRFSLGVAV